MIIIIITGTDKNVLECVWMQIIVISAYYILWFVFDERSKQERQTLLQELQLSSGKHVLCFGIELFEVKDYFKDFRIFILQKYCFFSFN